MAFAPMRHLSSTNTTTATMNHEIDTISNHFGKHLFKGDVAAPYLERHGLARDVLSNSEWAKSGQAPQVAAAVLDWARDHEPAPSVIGSNL
jgi:hypothetical protein